MNPLEVLIKIIAGHRLRYVGEPELRDSIADILTKAGIQFVREFILDAAAGRLDFFIGEHGVAIEVKTRGGRSELARQIMRYAKHPKIRGILVVTTRLQHSLPLVMAGKPVRILTMPRGLVA